MQTPESSMSDAEKLKAAIEALRALEGVPIPFHMHDWIRELPDGLQHVLDDLENEQSH